MSAGLDVSVVVPAFNAAAFIEPTLTSAITQTLRPREVIVADDGSTDETVALARQLAAASRDVPVTVVANVHAGPGAARNAGIRAASGEWIAFLDSDDFWLRHKLESVAATAAQHPKVNILCHAEEHSRLDASSIRVDYGALHDPSKPLVRQLYRSNLFSTSAVVCRKSLLLDHGMFDETLMSGQDYELWLRLSPYMKPVWISEVLGRYVERRGNITSGPLLRRLRRALRILAMHKDKVGPARWMLVSSIVMASYMRMLAANTVRRIAGGRGGL